VIGVEEFQFPAPRVPMPDPPPGPLADYFAETHRQQDQMIAAEINRREREQVWVRVTWRSERGRWATETLQTG